MIINCVNPLVSIIVPCYNVETYLRTCIESVIHQTYHNWELILVDDGSPDRSGKICDQYASNDSRIRVIHKSNGGLSSARNAGLDIIRGDYVTFLDSDDFWHVDYLIILVEMLTNHNADIAQCCYVRGVETTFPKHIQKHDVQIFDNHTIFTKQADKIVMWGKIYKAELFNGIRMPVGLIHEDDWTTWKLYYKAKCIVVTSLPLYYYTYNPQSIMSISRKLPDLTYFNAYLERISYFETIKEKDLEIVSRMQFCKSLLSLYSNKILSDDQKKDIKNLFDLNWRSIRHTNVVPLRLKFLFLLFYKVSFISYFIHLIKYIQRNILVN